MDANAIRQALHALEDTTLGIEEQFLRDHPNNTGCSADERDQRLNWLIDRLKLPDRYWGMIQPDDVIDQSTWTLTVKRMLNRGGEEEICAIKLTLEAHFPITHWLMSYAWFDPRD